MYAFEQIKGNQRMIQNLKTALAHHTVSHAYLFAGGEGMGKKLMANTFAKGLECEDEKEKPCGRCSSCRVFESRNHPDVLYVTPSGGKKSIGVEDIRRQVVEEASLKPYRYAYKVFVIDQADTMTVQAQNALLKTLEEPPAYCVFLLLARNMDKLLDTVLSRCVVVKLRPLPHWQVSEAIAQKCGLPKEQADVLAEYAQGSIGRGLSAAQSESFHAMREDVAQWLCCVKEKDKVSLLELAKDMERYKDNSQDMLELMYLWYRDVFVYQCTAQPQRIIQQDKKEQIISQAGEISADGLAAQLEAVWEAKNALSQNANVALTLEVMLMKLKESTVV